MRGSEKKIIFLDRSIYLEMPKIEKRKEEPAAELEPSINISTECTQMQQQRKRRRMKKED